MQNFSWVGEAETKAAFQASQASLSSVAASARVMLPPGSLSIFVSDADLHENVYGDEVTSNC